MVMIHGYKKPKVEEWKQTRKEKSWARHEYEYCYRLMRRGFNYDTIAEKTRITLETIAGADYSYQAKDMDVHGWSSNIREKRFNSIKWRVMSHWYGLSS